MYFTSCVEAQTTTLGKADRVHRLVVRGYPSNQLIDETVSQTKANVGDSDTTVSGPSIVFVFGII